MAMELRQLRAFLEVVDQGHFGRAAARLHLTQPALTQRIQSLERELGVQVLQRSAREVRLTPAGELLLPYAKSIVRVEERAQKELTAHVAGTAGRLRLAYLANGDVALPSRIVIEFRRCYPMVELETTSGSTRQNLQSVAAGLLDAAFIAVSNDVPEGVRVRGISYHGMVLAMPQGHRLSALKRVPVADLAGEPLIVFPSDINPALAASFTRWLTRHAGAPLNIVACEPVDQAVEMVANSGGAMTFISEEQAARSSATGIVFRPMSPGPMAERGLAYGEGDASPTVANLLKSVDEVVGPSPSPESIPEDSELFTLEGD